MSADLGKRLTELRKYNRLTREELAARLFVKAKDIEKWETGQLSPDGEQLIKLSQIYKMPIDEILLNFDTDGGFDYSQIRANPPSVNNNANISANSGGAKKMPAFNLYAFPYPVIAFLAYLCIGVFFNIWHPTWLIFLTIPIYYMLIATSRKKSWYAFPYPILVIFIYLAACFMFNVPWHPTWLIVLTIPVYYEMVAVSRAKGFRAKANRFPYPVLCVLLYLAIGFDYNIWHPTWMLFITIPIYYMVVNSIKQQ